MRLIDADKLYDWIRTECNPYGKPTIDFESGNRVLDIIKRMPTAFNKESVIQDLEALKDTSDKNLDDDAAMAYAYAIAIVERGGIE